METLFWWFSTDIERQVREIKRWHPLSSKKEMRISYKMIHILNWIHQIVLHWAKGWTSLKDGRCMRLIFLSFLSHIDWNWIYVLWFNQSNKMTFNNIRIIWSVVFLSVVYPLIQSSIHLSSFFFFGCCFYFQLFRAPFVHSSILVTTRSVAFRALLQDTYK